MRSQSADSDIRHSRFELNANARARATQTIARRFIAATDHRICICLSLVACLSSSRCRSCGRYATFGAIVLAVEIVCVKKKNHIPSKRTRAPVINQKLDAINVVHLSALEFPRTSHICVLLSHTHMQAHSHALARAYIMPSR